MSNMPPNVDADNTVVEPASTPPPPAPTPIVHLVDDDIMIRNLLTRLLQANNYEPQGYASAEDFLANYRDLGPTCLVLDVHLPGGMSGIDLIETMRKQGNNIPVLMLSARGDVPTAVKSMKLGAVDFLVKTDDYTFLLQHVAEAIRRDRETRSKVAEVDGVRKRFDSLTPRERELLDLLAEGQSTKMIASKLNISNRTVDHHRANLMAKTDAANVADLIRMWMLVRPPKK